MRVIFPGFGFLLPVKQEGQVAFARCNSMSRVGVDIPPLSFVTLSKMLQKTDPRAVWPAPGRTD